MSLSPIEKAASGALASVIANTLVYPLDLSKTLIQTQVKKKSDNSSPPTSTSLSTNSEIDDSVYNTKKSNNDLKYKNTLDVLKKIYAKKGVLGWYHGLISSILGTAAQNFSYFYWYTIVKKAYANMNKHKPNHKASTAIELFLGALAAAISQLFTMPIGVITTQQQTDTTHKSLYKLTKDVLEHDGITGLWKGLRVSLVLCINPSITYGSYERLKQILYSNKEFLGPLESFSIGVLAKSMATLATQPLIVSKAMLQKHQSKKDDDSSIEKKAGEDTDDEDDEDDVKFHHFTEALAHLWKTEKVKGLYKGVAPQLVKGVFVQGLLFMFKDQIELLFVFLLQLLKSKKTIRR